MALTCLDTVGFVRKDRRFDPHAEPRVTRRAALRRLPSSGVVRLVVFAAIAAVGAAWALARHYAIPPAPMLVPARSPGAAPTFDPDAGEIPVPDIEKTP